MYSLFLILSAEMTQSNDTVVTRTLSTSPLLLLSEYCCSIEETRSPKEMPTGFREGKDRMSLGYVIVLDSKEANKEWWGLIQKTQNCPGQVGQLVGVSSHPPKCCGVNPWSGRIWEATNRCLSLPPSRPKTNKHILR